jgi:hypothetical protein
MPKEILGELTHYTTLSGLMGIIDNRKLWASNASFLNDKAELLHGFEAAKLAVQGKTAEAERKWIRAVVEALSEIESEGLTDTFITCFCQQHDVLSLWRGYGGTEQGVAVTFDGNKIAQRLKKVNSIPAEVIYAQVSTVKKFRASLKEGIKDLTEWEDVLGEYTAEGLIVDARKLVSELLPRFKHNGFRDEREFRFVVHGPKKEEIKFRQKGGVIVPYVELSLGPTSLPINFITVGPGNDAQLTQKSIELYLHAKGYGDVAVRKSDVPFRP